MDGFLELTDGNFLVWGFMNEVNGVTTGTITKLDRSGNKVPGFKIVTYDRVTAAVEMTGGKLLVAGIFKNSGGGIDYLVRIDEFGNIDPTFSAPGIDFSIDEMRKFSTGKVLVVGVKPISLIKFLARLNDDGSLDETYPVDREASFLSSDVKLCLDGDDNVYAYFQNIKNFFRFRADGSIDKAYAPPAFSSSILSFGVSNGKLVVAGSDFIKRLNTDGSVDAGFNPVISPFYKVTILPRANGNLLVSGPTWAVSNDYYNFAELDQNGVLVKWRHLTEFAEVNLMTEAADGSIMISGNYQLPDSYTKIERIGLLNPDLTTLESFKPSVVDIFGSGLNVTANPDGRILVYYTGSFLGVGDTRQPLVMLNSDGSVDTKFKPSLGPFTDITGAALQKDGKVIVGGSGHVNNQSVVLLSRLNQDGSLDQAFQSKAGVLTGPVGARVQYITIHKNKIWVCGGFDTWDGAKARGII